MDENVKKRVDNEKQSELATAIEDNIAASEDPARKTRREVLRQKGAERVEREGRIAEAQRAILRESALQSVRYTRTLITGKVVSVSEMVIDGENTVIASIMLPNKTLACIPYDDFYLTNIMDMSTVDLSSEEGKKEYFKRRKQMLTKNIGLEVSLCIKKILTNYDGYGHDLILGSRKEACERIREQFFRADNDKCKEGEEYQMTILSVAPHSLSATFKGVDFKIQQNSLTNRYLLNLRDHYYPGGQIKFILRNLDLGKNPVEFFPDTKAAELEEMKTRLWQIQDGSIAHAVITNVYKKSKKTVPDIYAYLPDYDLACKIPYVNAKNFGESLESGYECSVVITGRRDSGYLDARIIALLGTPNLFNHQ